MEFDVAIICRFPRYPAQQILQLGKRYIMFATAVTSD